MDGDGASEGGLSAPLGGGGVSERVVEGAIWGTQVSGAGLAQGAIGVVVGDVGVQREAVDSAGVAARACG